VVSVTPRPRFTPGESTPGTPLYWVGPTAGLDAEARGKILSALPGIELRSPDRPIRSQTLYLRKAVPESGGGTLASWC